MTAAPDDPSGAHLALSGRLSPVLAAPSAGSGGGHARLSPTSPAVDPRRPAPGGHAPEAPFVVPASPWITPSPHRSRARHGGPQHVAAAVPRCPHQYPPRCTHLWISPSRCRAQGPDHLKHRLVHRVCAQLSTAVHRTPVGCDTRVISGGTLDHNLGPRTGTPEISTVFPGKAVDQASPQAPVDRPSCTSSCTSLWITVDGGPEHVDDSPSIGGRRVGTIQPPTGHATFPQRDHRSVHMENCPLTCTNMRFPRVPQPLRR